MAFERTDPVGVVFVTTSMEVGGAERLLADLIRRLDRRRFAPSVVCLKSAGRLGQALQAEGVSVDANLSSGRFDVQVIGRLGRLFRQNRTAVVCTLGAGGDRSFWGPLAARCYGVPVVISCPHSMGISERYEMHNRLIGSLTDAYIAIARRQKKYLVQTEGLPARKITVIHNGIDLERFSPAETPGPLRAAWNIPLDAPVAGIVARLRREKNVALFLRAAAAVHARIPNAHFVIVGDGAERSDLVNQACDLGIDLVVHFVGQRDDIPDCLRVMNVVTLTSVGEAFPLALLEAMACGKPVVATDVGAVREMVVHEQTGYLVPTQCSEPLSTALTHLLAHPDRAAAMGQNARAHVAAHFDLNQMVRRYEQLFGQLLNKKLSGSRFPFAPLCPALG